MDALGRPVHGLVLAGGRSSRMGTDKAKLLISGEPLIVRLASQMREIAQSVAIASGSPQRAVEYRELLGERFADVAFVADQYPGGGPIAGLHAGLAAAPEGYVFVMACDMPDISKRLFKRMAAERDGDWDIIHMPGQPFHALYHTRGAQRAMKQLEAGNYRVMELLSQLKALTLEQGAGERAAFSNLNTPEDYANYTDDTATD